MPSVFTELDALADTIRRRVGSSGIVGIDGWTGVGKTTLAGRLATVLNGSGYDLDRALRGDQNRYVSALRLPEIAEALGQPRQPLFVSGICLLKVLGIVRVSLHAHVYVKRMATWGWPDEDELTGGLPEMAGSSGEAVRQELRTYHQDWQPQLVADYEFQWLD